MTANLLEIPDDEPWLAAYLQPGDVDLEPARKRARRASAGEVIRRAKTGEPALRLREAGPEDGASTTPSNRTVVVRGRDDVVAVASEDRTR